MISTTGRPEDAVRCPACDKEPGDSCDGPRSHPSRFVLFDDIENAVKAALDPKTPRVQLSNREQVREWFKNLPDSSPDELDVEVEVEVENRCGICGQTFQIAPDDPHWSTGRGPICPTAEKAERREYLPSDMTVICDCGKTLRSDIERVAHFAETGHRDGRISALPKCCPSCRSPNPAERFGSRLAIFPPGLITWCKDAWHDRKET